MKLNALLKTLGFLALAATPVVAGTAPAPKNPAPVQPAVNDDLGLNIGLGYHTNYIWRGLNMGQHWVDGTLGGAIPLVEGTRLAWDVNYGSLAGDQDHFAPNGANNFSFQRLQLGAAFQKDIGPVTASLGYRYYRNMGGLANPPGAIGAAGIGMQDGQEVSLGLATALGPINLATTGSYDYVNDSWYVDLDLNTNIAVTDSISIVPFFNVGYGHNLNWQMNGRNFAGFLNGAQRDDITGFTAITTGLRFPIKLNSRATLTPYIAGNLPLGATENIAGSARNAGLPDTPFKSVLFGGVTLNVRF
jgi:hypothetical protein